MMFTKSDIRRVTLVITRSRYREFIVRLGEREIVHISGERVAIPERAVPPEGTEGAGDENKRAERILSASRAFLHEYHRYSDGREPFGLHPDFLSLFTRDFAADEKYLNAINKKNSRYSSLKSVLQQQISSAMNRLDRLNELRDSGIDLYRIRKMKLLSFIYGSTGNGKWREGAPPGWFYMLHGNNVLVLLPESEKGNALNILRESGFEDMSDIAGRENSLDEAISGINKRIHELGRRVERIELCHERLLDSWSRGAADIMRAYSLILKILGAEGALHFSDEVLILEGWLNMKDAGVLRSLLDDVCGSGYFLVIASKNETRRFRESVPVLLRNSRLFRPFELLVKMMGLPGNSEVDPTPVAAIAYVITFGVMFGDAGQGLILIITGLILRVYAKKKGMQSWRDFGSIVVACALSATLFGFLYGSVFSYEHLIPALLFHPMEHTMELFIMAIMMGVVFISIGIAFNIVNRFISGDYEESFFGTRGVLGLAVYVSVIFIVMRYILTGVEPSASVIALIGIPFLFLFALRGPLSYLFLHYDEIFHNGLFEYTVESIIELIEMFSGLLGNTISFIRAGAFALSHAGLSIAVFTLAGIVDPEMNGVGAVSVIITGNIFIILLEGLVCGIQSMRLEYYEFFGKFFMGDGVPFNPFSLKSEVMNNGG